jgi:hypothetical protein
MAMWNAEDNVLSLNVHAQRGERSYLKFLAGLGIPRFARNDKWSKHPS